MPRAVSSGVFLVAAAVAVASGRGDDGADADGGDALALEHGHRDPFLLPSCGGEGEEHVRFPHDEPNGHECAHGHAHTNPAGDVDERIHTRSRMMSSVESYSAKPLADDNGSD